MKLKKWWYRSFCVISIKKAEELNLTHYRNIYGDEIMELNWARSLWSDENDWLYRVASLVETSDET